MGKFEIFENLPNGREIKIGEQYNRILDAGRQYALDLVFGIESWHSGVAGFDGSLPASGAWDNIRAIAVGNCADDNIGWAYGQGWIESAGSGILVDSIPTGSDYYMHFPNLGDTYMTSAASGNKDNFNVGTGLFYKTADRTIRIASQVTIEATFAVTSDPDATNASTILEGTELREMGITLSDHPTGLIDPITTRIERPHVLINRSVRTLVSGGYIQDNPITVGTNPITIRYTFGESATG